MASWLDEATPAEAPKKSWLDEAIGDSRPKIDPYAGAKAGGLLLRALRGAPGGVYGETVRAAESGVKSLVNSSTYGKERDAIRTEEGLSLDPVERAKQVDQIQKQDYASSALGIVGVPSPFGAAKGPLSGALASGAERAAVRSGYGDRTAFRKAFRGKDERIQETGRFLLDENVPLNPKGMRDRTTEIMHSEAGPDVALIAGQTPGVTSLTALRDKVLGGEKVSGLNKSTLTRGEFRAIQDFFDDQIAQHGSFVGPDKVHEIRQLIDKAGANWTSATKDVVNNAWKEARFGVSDELGQAMNASGAGPEWTAANKRYENAAAANRISTTGAERVSGNQFLRPSEKIAAIVAAASALESNDAKAVALPLAYIALNRFAMPAAARTMNAASKLPIDYAASQAAPLYVNPKTQEQLLADLLMQIKKKKEPR
jgi:hypothetical protein